MIRRLLRVLVIATFLCVSFPAARGFTPSHALRRQPTQQVIPRYDKNSRNRGVFHRLAQKDDDEEANNQLDWNVIGRQFGLFQDMAFPYYEESTRGRWLLAGLLVYPSCLVIWAKISGMRSPPRIFPSFMKFCKSTWEL